MDEEEPTLRQVVLEFRTSVTEQLDRLERSIAEGDDRLHARFATMETAWANSIKDSTSGTDRRLAALEERVASLENGKA